MTESYTVAAAAGLIADVYREQHFVKIVFPSYTLMVCDSTKTETLNGDSYDGIGSLGSISVISETADVSADPVQLSLTGIDVTLAATLRDFSHQGSAVTIQMAQFDANDTIVPDPVTVFAGTVDTMSWRGDKVLTVSVQCDSYLRLLFRGPDGRRRMQADQEAIFSGDKGLEFSAQLTEEVPWGVPGTISPAAEASRQANLIRRVVFG